MAKKKSVSKDNDTVTIEFTGDSSIALEEFGKITKRNVEEVVSDALRTYMWVLSEQTFGGTVNARHRNSKENRDLVNIVKDRKAAKKYLPTYRALMRKYPNTVSIQEN